MDKQTLILASASPRRRDLLTEAGYRFRSVPADVDEDALSAGMAPIPAALRLAEAKAQKVAMENPSEVVLAADTVVALGEQLLGKPTDAAHAVRMLRLLEGTTHIVITGVCLMGVDLKLHELGRAMSAVHMRRLAPQEIQDYVKTGSWRGKAGGYGIQDDDPFVTNCAGSWSNIVGLPMELVGEMLGKVGVTPENTAL